MVMRNGHAKWSCALAFEDADFREAGPGRRRPDAPKGSDPVEWLKAKFAGGLVSTTSSSIETLVITDVAAGKVGELLEQEGNPDLFLRVAVRPGGCSGFSYEMFFDTELADDDLQTTAASLKVVVDPASATLLMGSTLDYKDGLQGAGFSINNPNATRTCGCGQSFS